MTDAVALLLNLVTLKESGDDTFTLEVSRTHNVSETFTPQKTVKVDGVEVCALEVVDLFDAAVDCPILRRDVLERYMPARRPPGMPRSVSKGYCE